MTPSGVFWLAPIWRLSTSGAPVEFG
jgi:hypothetical protein